MSLLKLIDLDALSSFKQKLIALIPSAYAGSSSAGGAATVTNGIHYAEVDSTSTATVFTATVQGITELKDGTVVMLRNGVVTSASGFTVNINGLGAKPVYSNMATGNDITPTNPTRETTIFNINYTLLLVYSTDLVDGGCWINYRGYNSDNNTIGYQIRTNSYSLPMDSVTYRYRLLFTSADGTEFVPANNSTSTNATASRTVCQSKIDPFGAIVYYGTTASVAAGGRPSAAYLWSQYAISLGYSFNRTGAALTMTAWKPVYVKASPQTDGSAIIDSTAPYVQALPSTADGKIYIFLGVAYSATNIELQSNHPVYYHDGTSIKLWTGKASASITVDSALSSTSENPVQNKVINAALGNKASADSVSNAASIDSSGLITFKHGTTSLFTLQLPIYEPPSVTLITFTMPDGPSDVECNAEEGMTFTEWLSSEYYTGFVNSSWAVSGTQIRSGGWVLQLNGANVLPTDEVQEGAVYGQSYDD